MSLRNATSPEERGAPGLGVRLVAGYTLVAALVLGLAAVFLYRSLASGFLVEDTELLADQAEKVRGMLARGAMDEARHFIVDAAGARQLRKYYVRLLDAEGRVVFETPGMEAMAPGASGFPTPSVGELKGTAFWAAGDERRALLGAVRFGGTGEAGPWTFQVALDVGQVMEWLEDDRFRLAWVVCMGTMVIAGMGWMLTRSGLRPVREIAGRMRLVTAHDAGERLMAGRWPAELAELAGEFDSMLDRLRDSFRRVAQFSADVAHEFRTPLNNLVVGTSLVLSRTRAPEEYRQVLESNLEQFERLSAMIDSLLFIARADNAEARLEKVQFEAGEAVGEVCSFFSALAEERGITLRYEGAGVVCADRVLLRLAVTNLVSNALRCTEPGGGVVVTVVSCESSCVISVSDTGSGIAAEHQSRLFDRFYRIEDSRTHREGTGSGLGLAIVKSVLQMHRGAVRVESRVGLGSTFLLEFPTQET